MFKGLAKVFKSKSNETRPPDETSKDDLLNETCFDVAEVSAEAAWEIGQTFLDAGGSVTVEVLSTALLNVVDLGKAVPFVGPVAGVLLKFYDSFQTMQSNKEDFQSMRNKLELVVDFLSRSRDVMKETQNADILRLAMKELCKCVVDCTNLVTSMNTRLNKEREKVGSTVLNLTLNGKDKDKISSCMSRLSAAFSDFTAVLSNLTIVKDSSRLKQIKDILKVDSFESVVEQHLKSFNYQPNSRAWLHKEVDDWLLKDVHKTNNNNKVDLSSKVFWLQAGAGMGKTVFTAALVDRLNKEGKQLLGATFIKFNDVNQSNPIVVLKSLIYQLALKYECVIDFIVTSLDKKKSETESVVLYFEDILLPALKLIENKTNTKEAAMKPMVIVIDALDEAGVEGSTLRKDFLNLFSNKFIRKLPNWVKLFVTGRPEADVVDKLKSFSHVIDETNENHVKDLEDYIVFSLQLVFDDKLVVEKCKNILKSKCEGKFLYTAVIAEDISEWYCEDDDDQFSVESFTEKLSDLPSGIDSCYLKTFQKLSKALKNGKCQDFLLLMTSCMEPLSTLEVKYLLDMNGADDVKEFQSLVDHVITVYPLRECVDENELQIKKFFPFHKSVSDWLRDSDKSGDFYCNYKKGSQFITQKLLNRICISYVNSDNISIGVNLNTLNQKNDNVEKYLFKHLLSHLDKCNKLTYQYVSHYLLTSLSWIQSIVTLFGAAWCLASCRARLADSTWLPIDKLRQEITIMRQFWSLIMTAPSHLQGFDWSKEVCTQIASRLNDSDGKRIGLLLVEAREYIIQNGGWLVDDNTSLQKANGAVEMSFPARNKVASVENLLAFEDLNYNGFEVWNCDIGECIVKYNVIGEVKSLIFVSTIQLVLVFSASDGMKIGKFNILSETFECIEDIKFSHRYELHLFKNGNVLVLCYDLKLSCDELFVFDTNLCFQFQSILGSNSPNSPPNICIVSDYIIAVLRFYPMKKFSVVKIGSEIVTELFETEDQHSFNCIACNNGRIVCGCKVGLFFWKYSEDFSSFVLIGEIPFPTYSMCMVSDKLFVCGNNCIAVFDIENMKEMNRYENYECQTMYSLSNERIAGVSWSHIVVWNFKQNALRTKRVVAQHMTILLDGRLVTTFTQQVKIWNKNKNHIDYEFECGESVRCVCSLQDGRLVCVFKDRIELWKDAVLEQRCDKLPQDWYPNTITELPGSKLLAIVGNEHVYLCEIKSLSLNLAGKGVQFLGYFTSNKIMYKKDRKFCISTDITDSTQKLEPSYVGDSKLSCKYAVGLINGYVLVGGKSNCIINPETQTIEESKTIDLKLFPHSVPCVNLNHMFYCEESLCNLMRFPDSNEFAFRQHSDDVIFATLY